jgi:hypothetical protein
MTTTDPAGTRYGLEEYEMGRRRRRHQCAQDIEDIGS